MKTRSALKRLQMSFLNWFKEKLEENEDFRIEAEQHNFTSAQFAKKLIRYQIDVSDGTFTA